MSWSKAEITSLLAAGKFPGISFCQMINGKPQEAIALGVADQSLNTPVTEKTVFEAASLTKPLFAMLVLKLVQEGVIDLDQPFGKMQDIQDIPEYHTLHQYNEREQLTARIILTHYSGLPNAGDAADVKFYAKPGEKFGYSGYAYFLLQKIIEKRTGKTYAELTQEFIFDQVPMRQSYLTRPTDQPVAVHHNADMKKSLPVAPATPATGASGLYTTAEDYARFVLAWVQSRDELLQSAFKFSKEKTLSTDRWAIEKGVSPADLEQLAWGLGWGLLKTEEGIIAFHWGDNGDSKAFVAINIESQTGFVYFANSWNGLSIANQLISKGLKELTPALQYLNKKYDFETCEQIGEKRQMSVETFGKFELRNPAGWQEKLKQNVIAILTKHPENFGEIHPDNTPDWEEHLKSQLAEQLSRQPNTGLETFLQRVLDLPKQVVEHHEALSVYRK